MIKLFLFTIVISGLIVTYFCRFLWDFKLDNFSILSEDISRTYYDFWKK